MRFSETLKQLRTAANLSQLQLANAVGITDRQVRRYESSVSEPTLSVLIALADFFSVSIDYLVGRSDNPQSHTL